MFASVSTYQGPPDRVDEGLRPREHRAQPPRSGGLEGAYLLVDRRSGKVLTVTLWESEGALRASEEASR